MAVTTLSPFVVLKGRGLFYEVLGDTPTPALIDACSDGRPHDAYQHPDTGFWRLRDDKYDAPGTEYTSVYVGHRPECQGHADMPMPHLVEWGTELVGGRCADHREVTCPGSESVASWGAHRVAASEELFQGRCFDCATVDGIPTPGYPELTAGIET